MEKYRVGNSLALVISGTIAIVLLVKLLGFFLIAFLFSFDDFSVARFFSLNTIAVYSSIIFWELRIVPSIVVVIALFLYVHKKYIFSTVLCILAVVISVGIMIDLQNKKAADSRSFQEEHGQRNVPPSNYLLPIASFPLPDYHEISRVYYKDFLTIVYKKGNDTESGSSLIFSERAIGLPEVSDIKSKYIFSYAGRPGVVVLQEKAWPGEKEIAPGKVNYRLYWDDNDKTVEVSLTEVDRRDLYLQELPDMLKNLERVK